MKSRRLRGEDRPAEVEARLEQMAAKLGQDCLANRKRLANEEAGKNTSKEIPPIRVSKQRADEQVEEA